MLQPKPNLRDLAPCPHGGPDLRELEEMGLPPDRVQDFSVNCNPFGPPPAVKDAAERAVWDRLPDPHVTRLRQALAAALGVRPANIVAGNGSVELIRFVALAFFGPGDPVAIAGPTFGEYETSLRIAGVTIVACQATEAEGFRPDLGALSRVLSRAKGLFLCNPNNPTGVLLSVEEIEGLARSAGEGLLVLDEAYMPFVDGGWDSLALMERSNLIVLRSMTKDFALGGLRLGYAVGPEPLMETLRKVLPPWSVNALAQEAGVLAMEDRGYPARCLPAIIEARDYLMRELAALGLRPCPSRANFFLLEVGDATSFRKTLLKEGFLVRDCASFGLPRHVRISARTMPECRQFVQAVRSVLAR